MMQRARGDDEEVGRTSATRMQGEIAVRRSLEESFLSFLLSNALDALLL